MKCIYLKLITSLFRKITDTEALLKVFDILKLIPHSAWSSTAGRSGNHIPDQTRLSPGEG